ncbi:DNA-binding response regulator [Aeromicrobium phragmitis]|uniref:DNA-binding response regulator n=1 Tax=Aeromicrobium phragmitis TaxID=2478914 RepID=A0A3L8PM78_9ACTN|nr:response regulator transcription factor [Aeromicrobium phragmitis]RLV56487.1 DNA-binding response regulator [Aeromicrobium phragmitis]
MTVRAVVVDDSTVIRNSLLDLLPGLEPVGSFAAVEELLAARLPQHDLVILDLHLVNAGQPEVRQGVAAVRAIARAGYRVCLYTQEERPFVLASCLMAGARGMVSKASTLEAAGQAFRDVAAGELVAPPRVLGLLDVLSRRRSLSFIGPRQREVLVGRARGLTYAQLSRKLFLSESTLRGYWREMTTQICSYLEETSPADIERALGLAPGDLVDLDVD